MCCQLRKLERTRVRGNKLVSPVEGLMGILHFVESLCDIRGFTFFEIICLTFDD